MKSIFIISLLTILIIAGGCFTLYALDSESERLYSSLSALEEDIENQNWDAASEKLDKFHRKWDKTTLIWSMLIDHFEIDNIEFTLSRLASYVKTRDKTEALSEMSNLKALIKHIPEKESFSFKNVF